MKISAKLKNHIHSIAKLLLLTFIFYYITPKQYLWAQEKSVPKDWWLRNTTLDGVVGVGFYQFSEKLPANYFSGNVIVAVLDTGIDTTHQIINPYLYVNTKEITGNGKDDDNNGYIDDRHGWNFLGGPTGNLIHDTPEVVREYVRLSKKSKNPSNSLSNKEWAYFREVSEKYERDKNGNKKKLEEYRQAHVQYQQITGTLNTCKRILERDLSGKNLSYRGIKELMPKTDSAQFAKAVLMQIMEATDTTLLIQEIQNELKQAEEDLGNLVRDYSIAVSLYDTTWRPRQIIGDTENNEEKFYGNADVRDPTGHGTSVAGIMALLLQKLNEQGHRVPIKILPVRIVPSAGDERDKDIANGIVYAVNQGAKIINLSFGKYYSPYPEVVQQAILYGTEKDVLFVHAAGNEGINIDSRSHFPLPPKQNLETAWIEVGASGPTLNETLAASFSNYGKKTVDLYAPGVDLYCPTLQNKFGYSQGTSLAAPVVSICAALLWSYNTKFKALDVKDKLISNTKKYKTQVYIPKLKKHVPFNELSKSGGILWLPGIFSKD
ncbi:MAG: S8 family serine peptidase [Cyclobacteriaceae bacterium]|jgi:cell wall-associated protease|nr:S8 family serine peptidase [Cytophagales bacterium]MCZ8329384.1 S8 family serine peptidase [Cyclobacteriaceae bacterium]